MNKSMNFLFDFGCILEAKLTFQNPRKIVSKSLPEPIWPQDARWCWDSFGFRTFLVVPRGAKIHPKSSQRRPKEAQESFKVLYKRLHKRPVAKVGVPHDCFIFFIIFGPSRGRQSPQNRALVRAIADFSWFCNIGFQRGFLAQLERILSPEGIQKPALGARKPQKSSLEVQSGNPWNSRY